MRAFVNGALFCGASRQSATVFPLNPACIHSARATNSLRTLSSISVKTPRVEAASNEVLLPSVDRMPVPSSPLLGREAQGKMAADLRPWQVETLSLRPSAALEFLCFATRKEMLQPGVMAGVDLAYSAAAMRFAGHW